MEPPGVSDQPAASDSPVQVALSWFQAINHKNSVAAKAHFEPQQVQMMEWGGGDTSLWPTFSDVVCQPIAQGIKDAGVSCTFHESQAASVGNPDSFWNISMHRDPSGPWLIDNYGQG